MKRSIALILVLTLLLCGCGGQKAEATPAQTTPVAAETTAEPTTEATTEPTTVPTEPIVYRNPVNGELLDEPFTGRIYANTVSNLRENLPHVGSLGS